MIEHSSESRPEEAFTPEQLDRVREEMRIAFERARTNVERAEVLLLAARLHELAHRHAEGAHARANAPVQGLRSKDVVS